MGLIADSIQSNSTSSLHTALGGVASGSSVPMPLAAEAGDMVLMFLATATTPATGFTGLSSWTSLVDKNATSSTGGRISLYSKVISSTDVTSGVAVTASGAFTYFTLLLRSTRVSGSSIQVGNPPSSGSFASATVENTVSGTSITFPQCKVDNAADLRICMMVGTTTGITLTPPTESSTATNPFKDKWFQIGTTAGNSDAALNVFLMNIPVASDSGSTVWTTSNEKSFGIIFAAGDGTNLPPDMGSDQGVQEAAVLIRAVGSESIQSTSADSVTGRGGGSGISVF